MKLPAECARDHRKLQRFLLEIERTVNKIIRGVQKQTELTATELVARPTYAEEFQNIRENVHKVVLSTLAEDWMSE